VNFGWATSQPADFLATFDQGFRRRGDNDGRKAAALGYGGSDSGPGDEEIDKLVAERTRLRKGGFRYR